MKTSVRSQFGFKLESVWNQRFTAGANSPIEPANRLWSSDFWKIRNMVDQTGIEPATRGSDYPRKVAK